MSTTSMGDNQVHIRACAAEMLVALRFSEKGYVASFPLRPCAYDLIVDKNGSLARIQVKQAGWQGQRKRKAGLGDRSRWRADLARKNAAGKKHRRAVDEFDWLVVVCVPDEIYVIPIERLVEPSGTGLIRQIAITRSTAKPRRGFAGRDWQPYLNNFGLNDVAVPPARKAHTVLTDSGLVPASSVSATKRIAVVEQSEPDPFREINEVTAREVTRGRAEDASRPLDLTKPLTSPISYERLDETRCGRCRVPWKNHQEGSRKNRAGTTGCTTFEDPS